MRPPFLYLGENLTDENNWVADAACAKAIADEPKLLPIWTDERSRDKEYARFICEECPVRSLCLLDAVEDPTAEGIRGGFEFTSGGLLKKEREKLRRSFPRIKARVRHQNVNQAAS